MWNRGPVKWSPVEIDYLIANKDQPIMQLTVALAKSRAAIKNKLDELTGKPSKKKDSRRTKIGKRDDIIVNGKSLFLRSAWEGNICRYFNHLKIKWTYEPQVFFFEGIKHGTTSYCPDFIFSKENCYLECKGMLTSKGKAAINRFKKYYPNEFKKLHAVVGRPGTTADKFFKKTGVPIYAYMSDLNKDYGKIIKNWE